MGDGGVEWRVVKRRERRTRALDSKRERTIVRVGVEEREREDVSEKKGSRKIQTGKE